MEHLNMTTLASRIPSETAAYKLLERLRWKGRPVCPHCGVIDGHYLLKAKRSTTTGKVSKRRTWKCRDCKRQFSVLVGTIFHGSHIPVRTWLFVLFEMVANKNGMAAREVQRKYGLTPKSAWFMTQRIREAMQDRRPDMLVGTIIADETWIGGESHVPDDTPLFDARSLVPKYRYANKVTVLSILCRETGRVRSRVVPNVTSGTLADALNATVDPSRSVLWTDELHGYRRVGRTFRSHQRVNHRREEYVRADGMTTNPIESFFGHLKRSIDGTHCAVSRQHLHRYLAEFDFRHSTRELSDSERLDVLVGQVKGRRLMYRPLTQAA
jgi:transposase-like protein